MGLPLPVLLGAPGIDIHVTDREQCPACTRASANEKAPPILHIGYARRIADLPSWCARVCAADEQPVSARWWWTVARPDGQDALPTRLDWDPATPRGHQAASASSSGEPSRDPCPSTWSRTGRTPS